MGNTHTSSEAHGVREAPTPKAHRLSQVRSQLLCRGCWVQPACCHVEPPVTYFCGCWGGCLERPGLRLCAAHLSVVVQVDGHPGDASTLELVGLSSFSMANDTHCFCSFIHHTFMYNTSVVSPELWWTPGNYRCTPSLLQRE